MESVVTLIQEVGFPIAAALGLGWFIYKLIMRIVDGMETKLDTVDEKVENQIAAIEERLGTKLDSQHGILVALIDRIRSLDNEIIRQDTLIKTILGVPQLIDSNKIVEKLIKNSHLNLNEFQVKNLSMAIEAAKLNGLRENKILNSLLSLHDL